MVGGKFAGWGALNGGGALLVWVSCTGSISIVPCAASCWSASGIIVTSGCPAGIAVAAGTAAGTGTAAECRARSQVSLCDSACRIIDVQSHSWI